MTYSIVAFDEQSGARGVAVASKALCVGAHVPWGRGGVGALATQAWHDLRYGWEGLALLEDGHSAASVVQSLTHGDPDAPHRQLGVVDAAGRVASYTGSRCLLWAGGMCGNGYAVQGNLLAGPGVVEAMADAYEQAERLPFPVRLVHALRAGDEAGGDRRGRQSAALKIWRGRRGSASDTDVLADLRVDDAARPVHRLQDLLVPYWIEHGSPSEIVPMTDELRARVAERLGTTTTAAEHALELWAGEQNLESRFVPGGVDRTVLNALEHGLPELASAAAKSLPVHGWPE